MGQYHQKSRLNLTRIEKFSYFKVLTFIYAIVIEKLVFFRTKLNSNNKSIINFFHLLSL